MEYLGQIRTRPYTLYTYQLVSEGSQGPLPLIEFGYSWGYCSSFHTTQYLGLECPAVTLSFCPVRVWFHNDVTPG